MNRNTYQYQVKEKYDNNLADTTPKALRYASMQCADKKAYIDYKGDWYCGLANENTVIYGKQYGDSPDITTAPYAEGQCKDYKALKIPNDSRWICHSKIKDGQIPSLTYIVDNKPSTTYMYSLDLSKGLCESNNAYTDLSKGIVCGKMDVSTATNLKDAKRICGLLNSGNNSAYKKNMPGNQFVCGLQTAGQEISKFNKSEIDAYFS